MDPEAIAVLSIGSSKVVTFTGGPSPWILDKTGYYEDAETDNISTVRIQPVNTGGQSCELYCNILCNITMATIIANHKYYVVCRELGDQVIQLLHYSSTHYSLCFRHYLLLLATSQLRTTNFLQMKHLQLSYHVIYLLPWRLCQLNHCLKIACCCRQPPYSLR